MQYLVSSVQFHAGEGVIITHGFCSGVFSRHATNPSAKIVVKARALFIPKPRSFDKPGRSAYSARRSTATAVVRY